MILTPRLRVRGAIRPERRNGVKAKEIKIGLIYSAIIKSRPVRIRPVKILRKKPPCLILNLSRESCRKRDGGWEGRDMISGETVSIKDSYRVKFPLDSSKWD